VTVDEINGAWHVVDRGRIIAGPFTNESAWIWIDRHQGEPIKCGRMIRQSTPGVRDRTAVDLAAIQLIIRTELEKARERMLPQIEAVLRETYSEIP
jgi:hypothetical protein